ncbi:MAG: Rpn family recombination-promoting nuclease/putative transposase [Anaerolineales bacterium]
MTLNNPHDRFFKESFSRQEVARDFARHYLPADVVTQLDLSVLNLVKDSFVDPELQEHFADLLYQTCLQDGEEAYLYLLFEHKSYPEPWIAFQLLRYLVRIWEQTIKQGPVDHLPPIVPIVVYHGVREWRIDQRFQGLFVERPALMRYIPDFRYQLCDLSDYSDEEIIGETLLRVTLLVMKHIYDGDLGARLPGIMSLLRELIQARSSLEYLEVVLRYLSTAAPELDPEEVRHVVEESYYREIEVVPGSMADTWLKQGRAQGVLENARESVIDVLEARFVNVPASITDVINDMDDLSQLKKLHKRAATVVSLTEFKQVLKNVHNHHTA